PASPAARARGLSRLSVSSEFPPTGSIREGMKRPVGISAHSRVTSAQAGVRPLEYGPRLSPGVTAEIVTAEAACFLSVLSPARAGEGQGVGPSIRCRRAVVADVAEVRVQAGRSASVMQGVGGGLL